MILRSRQEWHGEKKLPCRDLISMSRQENKQVSNEKLRPGIKKEKLRPGIKMADNRNGVAT